jgi:hypothetical protein
LRKAPTAAALVLTGCVMLCSVNCAVRHPASQDWRFTSNLLVPPGVAGPEVAQRTFVTDVDAGPGTCPREIRVRGKHVQVTVSRQMLLRQPAGWLTGWTEELEARNCIALGEGAKLADRIAGSLPLDPDTVFKVLYATDRQSGQVDIGPETILQVVSPVMEDGKDFELSVPAQATGTGNTLSLTLTAPGMLGYETAEYCVRPRPGRPGFTIVPRTAERHINGKTERVPQPATNYFQFAPDAAFFRLYYKAGQTDFTAIVVGARARAGFSPGVASCADLPPGMCVAIPKQVAVNPLIGVHVNGTDIPVNWGSTVGTAIRASGERQPESVLPRLSLSKPHAGRLAPVNFDRSARAVLDLVLTGGESISWK